MIVYYLIFSFISIFCLFDIPDKNERLLLLSFLIFGLIIFAGFRPEKASTDYRIYSDYFKSVPDRISIVDPAINVEPFYILIPSFLKSINIPVVYSFLVFAILGLSLKTTAIIKYSKFWFLSLLVYYSNFYLLHEMTQIRIGVAIGIYLLALPFIKERKFWPFACLIFTACTFHFSSIVLLFTYWISNDGINKKRYILLLGVSIFAGFFKIDPLSFLRVLPLGVLSEKLDFYYGATGEGIFSTSINLLNVFSLIDILVCALLMFYSAELETKIPYFNFLLKLYILSICFFYLCAFMPPLAFRVKEIFGIVQILLLPSLVFIFKEKYVSRLLIILIAFILLYVNANHNMLVKAYF